VSLHFSECPIDVEDFPDGGGDDGDDDDDDDELLVARWDTKRPRVVRDFPFGLLAALNVLCCTADRATPASKLMLSAVFNATHWLAWTFNREQADHLRAHAIRMMTEFNDVPVVLEAVLPSIAAYAAATLTHSFTPAPVSACIACACH
jgi:hypothetical protein